MKNKKSFSELTNDELDALKSIVCDDVLENESSVSDTTNEYIKFLYENDQLDLN